ncbi:hypothetical protein E2C01_074427 [Portunus trituberculatus]|uniref:Uncharacterized protein n=1 Tax=Portunus trituberculatus TaxID=210409 RepID=A0A5B7IH80_PORTR|nr:hypothetical protein [Portunus trituberculatus]
MGDLQRMPFSTCEKVDLRRLRPVEGRGKVVCSKQEEGSQAPEVVVKGIPKPGNHSLHPGHLQVFMTHDSQAPDLRHCGG